ncbi:SDR family NAD(P)-dependent oxidoreductase [Bordetella pseudohinzii]|uniref:3-oxoacyl-[acyl-carrier-protein] reductase FabG n=1 Tax=Bordetella pseudohinzii TaxID=1331258 RepID=A0A0J6CD72_9BORD|nr:SDR family oxidoreductase [Bordetella pseudohinzii]ANY16455.1 hypothetical protein BBN53_11440 [Bordetella pseudohinzii]KMM27597.1 hypothetical protein L540_00955 [Bordetella pseudohinzii]KXA78159.1 hypothetical protein AW877_12200 [Bordetella pseudohinzii]KXA82061.1 hypothetical protein AW878_02055 [Bordetella pseudohinzii]CUI36360.1 3-oxoacyl-[acyl-carrier-protein] reductase FabG [Bordetella pseudohinzii]
MNKNEFTGKRIVISGACGGLGRAFASEFAGQGARLMLLDQQADTLAALVGELGGGHDFAACDQAQPASLVQALSGLDQIDVLINNAGYMLRKPLFDTAIDEVGHLLGVNLTGAIILAMIAAQRMKQAGGTIVNIASQLAFASEADRAIYSVSKAGLVQFTRNAAREWAPFGIRSFALAPGVLRTNMTDNLSQQARERLMSRVPDGRMIEPEEIARIAAFLISGQARSFNGQTLIADGGYLIH